jgi:adenylate kinase
LSGHDKETAPAPAVILLGPPGTGKGTQAKLLGHCAKGPHISTGEILRAHVNARDKIGEQIHGQMKEGRLVPDALVNSLVDERLSKSDCAGGIILDGYPRTLGQADTLLPMLERHGLRPAVVYLKTDEDVIVARLSARRQCPVCGSLYNLLSSPPKVEGRCDLDGTPLITREDDQESVIRGRLREYHLATTPLLKYFREAGFPMLEIESDDRTPEQVMRNICRSLHAAGLISSPDAVLLNTAL